MDNEQSLDAGLQTQAPTEPVQSQPEPSTTGESQQAPSEKMFSQSQLQAIAAKEARKAEERAEARLRAEYERKLSTQPTPSQTQSAGSNTLGGMPQVSPEQIRDLIRQEASAMAQNHQAALIERDWIQAMEAEKLADPEFAELHDAIGIEAQPGLILAMQGLENKAKVVKDLAKNPSKYANILTLANGGSFKLAQIELNKLAASIKANEDAKQKPKVDAPLSQIKASNLGGDDGNLSTTDYRSQDWLRG